VLPYDNIEALVLRRSEAGTLSARAKEMLSMLLLAGPEAELSSEAAIDMRAQATSWRIHARDARRRALCCASSPAY